MSGIYSRYSKTNPVPVEVEKEGQLIEQNELKKEWTIQTKLLYPQPTVHVTQIGDRELEAPLIVNTQWEHTDAHTIRIVFNPYPCKGFVTLR